jgi:lipopolysaccharide export system permease protein
MVKMADSIIGKGLSTWVIIQLVMYSLAWMIVLIVPMAVLVATLMAFGTMSQNNEVAILKATGVSLYKMMIPPLIASVFVALILIYFNNNIYPDANHAARLLLEDISRKKPTLSLVPGVFSKEVPEYSILAREIDQEKNLLKEITIYDYSNPPKVNIVTATNGTINFSGNQKKLILDLNNGEIHESNASDETQYRRLRFTRHRIALPADQFTFEQTSSNGDRGDRELGAKELLKIADSLVIIKQKRFVELNKKIDLLKRNFKHKAVTPFQSAIIPQNIFIRAQQRIKSDENSILSSVQNINYSDKEIDRYWVEIHKKYSLPFACIIFVLIGAPLGTMTRKGGFGMAAGISLVFFLIYWSFLIGGEKLADRGILSPFWGIWSANILLGVLGIILMIKSAREKVTLSFDFITKLIPQRWKTTWSNPTDENDENN